MQVETAGELIRRALLTLASVTESAAAFDTKYSLTQHLYTTVEGTVAQAKASLTSVSARIGAAKESVSATVESAATAITSAKESVGSTVESATHVASDAAARVTSTVTGAANSAAARVSSTVSGVASSVGAHEPVQAAHAALQDLVGTLSSLTASALSDDKASAAAHPTIHAARELTIKATEAVGESLGHLRDAPLTEMPVVAALEALALARGALATVSSALASAYSSSSVASAVTVARERAVSAVSEATTQITTLRERISTGVVAKATSVANASVDFAVKKAVEYDASYLITERVKGLDAAYKVSDKVLAAAATAQSVASEVDRSLGVSDKATQVMERAKQLDTSITGGRATAIASSAIELGTSLAATAVDYAKTIAQKYDTAKATAQDAQTSPKNATATATSPAAPTDEPRVVA